MPLLPRRSFADAGPGNFWESLASRGMGVLENLFHPAVVPQPPPEPKVSPVMLLALGMGGIGLLGIIYLALGRH